MNIMLSLFLEFFKIGLFSIGGGYAMIPMIQRFLVGNGWLTAGEVADMIAISESTPGPFAVNIATFSGIKMSGLPGSLIATLGVILPSFIIVVIVATFFERFQDHPLVRGFLRGVRPAVVGLIASVAVTIGMTALISVDLSGVTTVNFAGIAIAAGSLIAIMKFKLHPILMIGISAGLGILFFA